MRAFPYVAVVSVALMPSIAQALEPTIIVISYHNLDYAMNACQHLREVRQKLLPNDPEVVKGVVECDLAGGDGRILGRRLEDAVMNQMAINPQCHGVHVFRENHPKYDGVQSFSELTIPKAQFHWELFVDYNPGREVHGWTLFPTKGYEIVGPFREGEGAMAQIAAQICIVAKGQGANIH